MSLKIIRTFFVLILVIGLVGTEAPPAARAAGPWYVSTTGDDGNDCLSATTPCATINGAISKATDGDTIQVGIGTYESTENEVVLIEKSITLSGGWNETFAVQSGMATIDGQSFRRGITVNPGLTVLIERFVVKNGAANGPSGIYNDGSTLTIRQSTISANATIGGGAGIGNVLGGVLILDASTVSDNTASFGGGIANTTNSTMTVNNSTISGNTATSGGGGIYNSEGGTLFANNATIYGNRSESSPGGGGIYNESGSVTLRNSIVAGNTNDQNDGPDCLGTINSSGYNLIGQISNCNFISSASDLTNVDPNLGQLIGPSGAPAYYPLLAGSLAIDAANPAGCEDQNGSLLTTDQRGVARVGACDIGAYEYTTPGPAADLSVVGGNGQVTGTNSAYSQPLKVAALDNQGSPVSGVTVNFTAPGSGPSGTFENTNTNVTSAVTDQGGVATASVFTANNQAGAYVVTASANGLGSVDFDLEQVERPANDNFAGAEEIPSLPFSIALDVSQATLEPDEPQTCLPTDRSVWYRFVPSRAMILLADTLGSSTTKISIYRATGPGITDLQSVQCVSSGGAITFAVDADRTYYFQVGAPVGETGTIQFGLSELTAITGRVTDALTGAPLPGDTVPFASASLLWVCGDGCLALVSSLPTSSDGRFRFDNYGSLGGTYLIEVSAGAYETKRFGPFEFSGANLEVGDLAIAPLPTIGSISGRLVDAVTGKPIAQVFLGFVQLFRCTDGNCSELVDSQVPDSKARFRFETDWRGNPLTAGTYQIWASADQYEQKITDPFSVGKGMHQSLGNLSLTSFPVRFSTIQPCPDISASGGECVFSVRIWNGLGTKFRGRAWSMVNASLPESTVGTSDFQLNVPKVLELDRGQSKILRFRFNVPGSGSPATAFICPRVFVGKGNNFLFNTVGFRELFCVLRNAQGLSIVSPQDATALAQPPVIAAATGTETESNNSCQTAQDVGAVPFPFVLDGDLDSTLQPDIDFYRFSGTPGVLIGIDHEGQPTGKGTLEDPLLAFFDSQCNLLAMNNDTNSANARLEIPIPSDGIFIVAATAYPDFGLTGGGNGSYQLTVAPVPLIGSISGRLTDIFGTPLRGDVEPFAFVRLLQCGEFGCFDVNSQAADSEGRFLFETDLNGAPLRAGNYQLVVTANQYREGQTEPFSVGEGEHHDVGDFVLDSFAVRFSDIQPCSIPAAGGICKFSVKITNGLSTRLSGKTWSIAGGAWIGSFTNFTSFQTGKARDVKLDPGKSKTLYFGFRVPGSVADGATICASVYIGQKPGAFFRPVGITGLFCLTKGAGGLRLMSAQEAQAASRQMQTQMLTIDPPNLPTPTNKER